MQSAEPPQPRQPFKITTILTWIIVGTGAFALQIYIAKGDTRYREAIKAVEDTKRQLDAIERKLSELQQRQ